MENLLKRISLTYVVTFVGLPVYYQYIIDSCYCTFCFFIVSRKSEPNRTFLPYPAGKRFRDRMPRGVNVIEIYNIIAPRVNFARQLPYYLWNKTSGLELGFIKLGPTLGGRA